MVYLTFAGVFVDTIFQHDFTQVRSVFNEEKKAQIFKKNEQIVMLTN